MKYNYGPLNTKLFVTVEEYNKAYRLAENPTNPDPRPMLAIIARWLEANVRAGGLVRNAHDAVCGFDWDILPSDPKNSNAVLIAQQMKDRFIASRLHHNFDVIIDGEFLGLTAMQLVWNSFAGKLQAALNVIASTRLYRSENSNGTFDFALVDDTPVFNATPITQEEKVRYIFSEFNPFKSSRPEYIGGVARIAVILTILKNFSFQDWSAYTEQFAEPFRTATYDDNADEKDKAIGKKAIKEFGRNTWAFVSDHIKFELLDVLKSGSIDAFDKLQQRIDDELAILLNGEANTMQLPNNVGSRAALQVLKLISSDRMWWRLKNVEYIVNEQYVAVDYFLNESMTDISLRPHFAFITDESQDRESNARIVTELIASNYELDDAEVSARTGFTVKKIKNTPATVPQQ